jgi:hypothetical protein
MVAVDPSQIRLGPHGQAPGVPRNRFLIPVDDQRRATVGLDVRPELSKGEFPKPAGKSLGIRMCILVRRRQLSLVVRAVLEPLRTGYAFRIRADAAYTKYLFVRSAVDSFDSGTVDPQRPHTEGM